MGGGTRLDHVWQEHIAARWFDRPRGFGRVIPRRRILLPPHGLLATPFQLRRRGWFQKFSKPKPQRQIGRKSANESERVNIPPKETSEPSANQSQLTCACETVDLRPPFQLQAYGCTTGLRPLLCTTTHLIMCGLKSGQSGKS